MLWIVSLYSGVGGDDAPNFVRRMRRVIFLVKDFGVRKVGELPAC